MAWHYAQAVGTQGFLCGLEETLGARGTEPEIAKNKACQDCPDLSCRRRRRRINKNGGNTAAARAPYYVYPSSPLLLILSTAYFADCQQRRGLLFSGRR